MNKEATLVLRIPSTFSLRLHSIHVVTDPRRFGGQFACSCAAVQLAAAGTARPRTPLPSATTAGRGASLLPEPKEVWHGGGRLSVVRVYMRVTCCRDRPQTAALLQVLWTACRGR